MQQHKDTRFILGDPTDRKGQHPDANFMDTGLPLAGCLRQNETYNQWLRRRAKREVMR